MALLFKLWNLDRDITPPATHVIQNQIQIEEEEEEGGGGVKLVLNIWIAEVAVIRDFASETFYRISFYGMIRMTVDGMV